MRRRGWIAIARALLSIVVLYLVLYYVLPSVLYPVPGALHLLSRARRDVFLAGSLLAAGISLRRGLDQEDLSPSSTVLYVVSSGALVTSLLLISMLMSMYVSARYLGYVLPVLSMVIVAYHSASMLPLVLILTSLALMLSIHSSLVTVVSAPLLTGSVVYVASSYVSSGDVRGRSPVKAGALAASLVLLVLLYLLARPYIEELKPAVVPIIDIVVTAAALYLLLGTITSIAQVRAQSVSLLEREIDQLLREEPPVSDKLRTKIEKVYESFVLHGDKKPLIKFIATASMSDDVLERALDAVLNYEDQPVPALLPGFLKRLYLRRNILSRLAVLRAVAKLLAEGRCSVDDVLRDLSRDVRRCNKKLYIASGTLIVAAVSMVLCSLYLLAHGASLIDVFALCEIAVVLSIPVPLLVSLASSSMEHVKTVVQRVCSG